MKTSEAWRPKENEWVWLWQYGAKTAYKHNGNIDCHTSGSKLAALEDFDTEKEWSWEDFVKRGNTWMVP